VLNLTQIMSSVNRCWTQQNQHLCNRQWKEWVEWEVCLVAAKTHLEMIRMVHSVQLHWLNLRVTQRLQCIYKMLSLEICTIFALQILKCWCKLCKWMKDSLMFLVLLLVLILEICNKIGLKIRKKKKKLKYNKKSKEFSVRLN